MLFAQKGFISGLVLDTNAEPMPGANISFKIFESLKETAEIEDNRSIYY